MVRGEQVARKTSSRAMGVMSTVKYTEYALVQNMRELTSRRPCWSSCSITLSMMPSGSSSHGGQGPDDVSQASALIVFPAS